LLLADGELSAHALRRASNTSSTAL
jgi:hypothetical protein